MKKKDLDEIKTKSISQLEKRLEELEKEKTNNLLELKMGKIKNVHLVNQKKKDIARIKTILRLKLFASSLDDQSGKLTFQKEGENVAV